MPPLPELERRLQERRLSGASIAMLDGYVAAIVTRPVSVSQLNWPAAGRSPGAFTDYSGMQLRAGADLASAKTIELVVGILCPFATRRTESELIGGGMRRKQMKLTLQITNSRAVLDAGIYDVADTTRLGGACSDAYSKLLLSNYVRKATLAP
jgi:hypothetical protein